jgi:hypothetical protein
MVIKIEGLKTRVKYYGIFDFKQLYRDIKEKLGDVGYLSPLEGAKNMMETYYSEKRSSDPREAKTIWIWWRTGKEEEGSPFYRQEINLDFHLRFLKDVEVMVDNEKKRAQQGEIEVWIDGNLYLDPKNEWADHWLMQHFVGFFARRVWRKQRESRKNSVIADVNKVQGFIKDSFEIKNFMPLRGQSFYDLYGYKKN